MPSRQLAIREMRKKEVITNLQRWKYAAQVTIVYLGFLLDKKIVISKAEQPQEKSSNNNNGNVIVGGTSNLIDHTASNSVILGGSNNLIGTQMR
jgi:hypothetical protein